MKKKITISIMIIVLLFGGAGLYILKQNSFNMVEQDVEIQTPQGKLTGNFVLPKNYTEKLGLVLTFVSKNFLSDATDDLRNFNSPVLLILGEEDMQVDVKDTERVYRDIVKPELLTVAVFPDADHSMLSNQTANSNLRALFISLFAPRQITIPGYMDEIEQFLKKLPKHT